MKTKQLFEAQPEGWRRQVQPRKEWKQYIRNITGGRGMVLNTFNKILHYTERQIYYYH